MARYYESIDHEVLLAILRQRGASAASAEVVADYLRLPDRHRSGRGITAGGSLSPLLIPLDEAMNRLWRRYGLFYVRYMDDFVLMAPTRHKLRRGRGVSGRRRRVRRSERQQGRGGCAAVYAGSSVFGRVASWFAWFDGECVLG